MRSKRDQFTVICKTPADVALLRWLDDVVHAAKQRGVKLDRSDLALELLHEAKERRESVGSPTK